MAGLAVFGRDLNGGASTVTAYDNGVEVVQFKGQPDFETGRIAVAEWILQNHHGRCGSLSRSRSCGPSRCS